MSDWPRLEDDGIRDELQQALFYSRGYLDRQPAGKRFFLGRRELSAAELRVTLELFEEVLGRAGSPESLQQELADLFDLYKLEIFDRPEPLLVTGYYEPTLEGRRRPSPEFPYPVYRRPDDLLTISLERFSKKYKNETLMGRQSGSEVVPYYSRREIDQEGRLRDRGLEILWTNDRLKLFFTQIQGSGQVILEDGTLVKLRYRAANGHPYFPIGRELIRRGVLKPEDVSLQTIYAYLRTHPEEQDAVLNLNPSYVFFQEAEGGPYGSLNVPLTPGRSVAVDLTLFPAGGLAWLSSVRPTYTSLGEINAWVPLQRWVTIQDSGGAIRGPGRLDFFWGSGEEAEMAAGHMRHRGVIYFLLKKEKDSE